MDEFYLEALELVCLDILKFNNTNFTDKICDEENRLELNGTFTMVKVNNVNKIKGYGMIKYEDNFYRCSWLNGLITLGSMVRSYFILENRLDLAINSRSIKFINNINCKAKIIDNKIYVDIHKYNIQIPIVFENKFDICYINLVIKLMITVVVDREVKKIDLLPIAITEFSGNLLIRSDSVYDIKYKNDKLYIDNIELSCQLFTKLLNTNQKELELRLKNKNWISVIDNNYVNNGIEDETEIVEKPIRKQKLRSIELDLQNPYKVVKMDVLQSDRANYKNRVSRPPPIPYKKARADFTPSFGLKCRGPFAPFYLGRDEELKEIVPKLQIRASRSTEVVTLNLIWLCFHCPSWAKLNNNDIINATIVLPASISENKIDMEVDLKLKLVTENNVKILTLIDIVHLPLKYDLTNRVDPLTNKASLPTGPTLSLYFVELIVREPLNFKALVKIFTRYGKCTARNSKYLVADN